MLSFLWTLESIYMVTSNCICIYSFFSYVCQTFLLSLHLFFLWTLQVFHFFVHFFIELCNQFACVCCCSIWGLLLELKDSLFCCFTFLNEYKCYVITVNVVASINVASMIIILTMVVFTTKLCRTFLKWL
jgi:hypothetical protein